MSEIRSVLVHLDASEEAPLHLAAACTLARRHGAEVIALYAATPAAMTMVFDVSSAAGPALLEIDRRYRGLALRAFDAAAQAAPDVRLHWRDADAGDPPLPLTTLALVHDLVVLAQRRPGRRWFGVEAAGDAIESLIFASGRGALVVPYTGVAGDFGNHVLVAWKPTREAARAVQAALPLLRSASLVHVVAWGADAADSAPALMQHLAQHGVACRPDVSRTEPPAAGDALLSRAADLEADLLVMGCYGHSRAREWITGGVTRTVLATMTLPTLLAH